MEKIIDYLEQTGLYLLRLSSVCCSLSCAQDAEFLPSAITIAESYNALCNILEAKAKEIDGVVSEYYKSRSQNRENKGEENSYKK